MSRKLLGTKTFHIKAGHNRLTGGVARDILETDFWIVSSRNDDV